VTNGSSSDAATGVRRFLDAALDQHGDAFKYGAYAATDDPDPDAFDASELVEWAAARGGAKVPDGSWLQYRSLHESGSTMSVDTALKTPGALLFRFSSDPLASADRPGSAGVAISLGDGRVIEATYGGVRIADAGDRFGYAASIPGFSDGAADSALLTHLDERLGALGLPALARPAAEPSTPVEPSPPVEPTPPAAPTPVPVPYPNEAAEPGDPLELRKQALDKTQELEAIRKSIEDGLVRRADVEAKAVAIEQKAIAKNAEELAAIEAARVAQQHAAELQKQVESQREVFERSTGDPDALSAAEGKLAELVNEWNAATAEMNRRAAARDALTAESNQLDTDAAAERIWVTRADEALTSYRAQERAVMQEADRLLDRSEKALADRLPHLVPRGSAGPDVPVEQIPGDVAPPIDGMPGTTPRERVEAWVEARRQSAMTREEAAADALRTSVAVQDVVDARRQYAAQADTKVATARAEITAEEARIPGLEARVADAKAQGDRFMRESTQERDQANALKAAGDIAGAEAADTRADYYFDRYMTWSAHEGRLNDSIREARARIDKAHEEIADFERLAQDYRREATDAETFAEELEQQATTWQREVDGLDSTTDKLESGLGTGAIQIELDTPEGTIVIDTDDAEQPATPPATPAPEPAPAPEPTSATDDVLGVAPVAATTEPVIVDEPLVVDQAVARAAPEELSTLTAEIDTSTAALLVPDDASLLDLSEPETPFVPEPESAPALDDQPDDSLPA
jgi:hypothetical protein